MKEEEREEVERGKRRENFGNQSAWRSVFNENVESLQERKVQWCSDTSLTASFIPVPERKTGKRVHAAAVDSSGDNSRALGRRFARQKVNAHRGRQ